MRLRQAALLLPIVVSFACADDNMEPMTRTKVQPSFDHTFDPAVGKIAVNNYVLSLNGAAMNSTYKGLSALFNGNMAYGVSATQIFQVNTANGATDFRGIGLPIEVVTDGSVAGAANYTSTLFTERPSQALGPKTPLGVYTVRETYAYSSAPDDDYVILKYTFTNSTDAAITGLYTGVLVDTDLGTNPSVNISTYDATQKAAVVFDNPPNPVARHAIVMLNRDVGGYKAWTNGGASPDPNTNAGWFSILSSPITTGNVGPADIRQYLGAQPITLQPGETQVVAVAFVGGDNQADLTTNIAAARAKSANLMDARPVLPISLHIASTLTLYTARLTFATAAQAAKFAPADTRCGDAPISSYLVTGNTVDLTFSAVDVNDELRTGDKMFCTGRLSDDTYFAGYDFPSIDADLTPVTALTHFTGSDYTPAFSPDGSRIVFGSARNGGGLFIMNVADGDVSAVQLTNGALDTQPSWSPDGSTIVFNRPNATGFAGGIFAVDVATHAVTRLTQNVNVATTNILFRNDTDPRYSPDGTRIAFRSQRGNGTVAPGNHIWLMGSTGDIAPRAPSTVLAFKGTSDLYPEWSADGSKIYFSSTGAARGELTGFLKIFTIDVAAGESSVQKVSDDEQVTWQFGVPSPDGRVIVSLSAGKIVLQDVASDAHIVPLFDPRITSFTTLVTAQNIAWTPDGKRFAFVGDNEVFITSPKHVVTPAERAESLQTSIQALIDDGLIGGSEGEQLQSKLGNVLQLVQSGSLNAAANNVNAFLNKVNALVNSRRINNITAEVLTTNANALLDQING